MIGRLAVLGVLLATLPLSVDVTGTDGSSPAGRTQVELAGGGGQFAIVSRGCSGEVVRVTRNQIASGALVVEQPLPSEFVLGIRAGNTHITMHRAVVVTDPPDWLPRDSIVTGSWSNPYVNPYVGWEGRVIGAGAGAIMVDRPLITGEGVQYRPRTTWHVRLGGEQRRLTVRWMEDVPLESEGHLSADLAYRPHPRLETGAFVGLLGPYDGAMVGVRGRVWITPDAAAQIKFSMSGQHSEYGLYGSVTARLPLLP